MNALESFISLRTQNKTQNLSRTPFSCNIIAKVSRYHKSSEKWDKTHFTEQKSLPVMFSNLNAKDELAMAFGDDKMPFF